MLVLASASPRRRELLTQAGYTFTVHPAHIPEDPYPDEDPTAYVLRLARQKAETVFAEITKASASEKRASAAPQVLGADTTVTLDSHILGKPESPADASRMLRLLSGRTHRVLTGVALVTAQSTQTAAESTIVHFLTPTDEEIAAYVASGDPMDKAGAYAIQGYAARWIPRIEGCYFNVVGLPISLVCSLLNAARVTSAAAAAPPD